MTNMIAIAELTVFLSFILQCHKEGKVNFELSSMKTDKGG